METGFKKGLFNLFRLFVEETFAPANLVNYNSSGDYPDAHATKTIHPGSILRRRKISVDSW